MRLAPHLLPLDLPSGKTLLDPGQEITYAYFLETGLASVVVAMANGNMVETGITGNDGLVGFSVLLDTKAMPTRTFMQIAGKGFKIKAQHLVDEFEKSGTLHKKINHYVQANLVLTGQTAACNRLHDIAERLARWLLMCHDRMESDTFSITHEFLGHMLGTPRSTVRWQREFCLRPGSLIIRAEKLLSRTGKAWKRWPASATRRFEKSLTGLESHQFRQCGTSERKAALMRRARM